MSVELMGKVWASLLPSDEKFVALALADFADDDGGHIYPSQKTVARKVGKSVRAVRDTLAKLVRRGILKPLNRPGGGPVHYRLDAQALPQYRPEESSDGDRQSTTDRPEVHDQGDRQSAAADPSSDPSRSDLWEVARECVMLIESMMGTVSGGVTEAIQERVARGYTLEDFTLAVQEARERDARRWSYVRAILDGSEPRFSERKGKGRGRREGGAGGSEHAERFRDIGRTTGAPSGE